jgi:hypothetical protein
MYKREGYYIFSDAPLIQDLIIKTFMEYKDEIPSSSALEETVH